MNCGWYHAIAVCSAALLASTLLAAGAAPKKVVFVAGPPSHGPGEHEHRAGCLLLKSCLDQSGLATSVVYSNGWPADPDAFQGADSIVLYCDGGEGHLALRDDHLSQLGELMKKKVGLVCIHYATEPTLGKGEKEFLRWIGGAFEVNWSVNPHWDANFAKLPKHPVTNGVHPYKINDEWYFHLRFTSAPKGLAPILQAVPGEDTMRRPDGPHEGNAAVREAVKNGEPQTVAWAFQRPDGGRGFGYTGGHVHTNWGNEDTRKLMLNAIVWTAHGKVPRKGVASALSPGQLEQNLDPKGRP